MVNPLSFNFESAAAIFSFMLISFTRSFTTSGDGLVVRLFSSSFGGSSSLRGGFSGGFGGSAGLVGASEGGLSLLLDFPPLLDVRDPPLRVEDLDDQFRLDFFFGIA